MVEPKLEQMVSGWLQRREKGPRCKSSSDSASKGTTRSPSRPSWEPFLGWALLVNFPLTSSCQAGDMQRWSGMGFQSRREKSEDFSLFCLVSQGTSKVHAGDCKDNTVANLEIRIFKLDNGSQNHMGALWKKLAKERAFLSSKVDKKPSQDAAMTVEEHEKSSKNKVRVIVKDVVEDAIEGVVEDVIEDVVHEKLATICRTQQQHGRQIAAIMNWIRDIWLMRCEDPRIWKPLARRARSPNPPKPSRARSPGSRTLSSEAAA
ncbi:hypothetical protein F5883DRAFT_716685 [Diaporthe sp. PMI_573]|nr:hypothetical protein F5883DRAFT_716685 [Diaporthaceae sp. PMI_573]